MGAMQMQFQEFSHGMADGSLSPKYAPWNVIVLPWAAVNGGPPYIIWLRSIAGDGEASDNEKELVRQ